MLVPFLFFCSGATALVYEVVWSKYLTLMFGSTVQAQTVVLAVFMGGLALGNRLFGARADKAPQPLALYGYVEVAIGLYAFCFNWIYQFGDAVFVRLGTGHLDHRAWLLVLKAGLSIGLLLGPTVLMGGTLPLLAAWLQRQSTDAGRWSARFYSINSLGAVFGAGLAGFYLVQGLGMVASVQMTALVNVLIGFTAVGLARRLGDLSTPPTRTAPSVESAESTLRSLRWSCGLVALTGGVSMGLEVLASRSLVLIFGASLQAFAIVLMAFILGIGLGGAVVASPRWQRLRRETSTCALLLGAATWVGFLVLGITKWVEIYLWAKTGLAASLTGFQFHQVLASGMSMIVLGVPAGLIGAVLPLWIRALEAGSAGLGNQVGRLLTWNTLGAVAGVLFTGFGLMPNVGLRGSFYVLVILLCAGGSWIAWVNRSRPVAILGACLGAGIAVVSLTTGEGWRQVLSSGAFRMRGTYVDPQLMEKRRLHIKILFYEDAADATVSVEQGDGVAVPADIGLRINGKVDASSRVDLSTQYLLAHVPLAARPESRDVFVLGLGSGVTAGALLGHPVETVTIAENCQPVLRGSRFFAEWNRNVLADPRVRVWNDDARTVLKLGSRHYDVIISEPSNPWMVGVGSVFSREFYQLAASRLKEGGLMCQWFHVYEMSDEIVSLVLRTFNSVFPYIELWDPGEGDIILLGGLRPWKSSAEVYRQVFDRERVRSDFKAIGLETPEALWARQLASQRTAFAIAGEGPTQSDAFPILEYEAPKAFFVGSSAVLFSLFDERTWQADLAMREKVTALASLDVNALRAAFGRFTSVNDQLYGCLVRRFEATANRPATADTGIPCVFQSPGSPPIQVKMPDQVSEEWRHLLEAMAAIQTDPAASAGPATIIQNILATHRLDPRVRVAGQSPMDVAALGAKACLRYGDLDQAGNLVLAGLKIDPRSPELLYIGRILERKRAKPPSDSQ
jgi:predicted membrane-bound spermidine synthase